MRRVTSPLRSMQQQREQQRTSSLYERRGSPREETRFNRGHSPSDRGGPRRSPIAKKSRTPERRLDRNPGRGSFVRRRGGGGGGGNAMSRRRNPSPRRRSRSPLRGSRNSPPFRRMQANRSAAARKDARRSPPPLFRRSFSPKKRSTSRSARSPAAHRPRKRFSPRRRNSAGRDKKSKEHRRDDSIPRFKEALKPSPNRTHSSERTFAFPPPSSTKAEQQQSSYGGGGAPGDIDERPQQSQHHPVGTFKKDTRYADDHDDVVLDDADARNLDNRNYNGGSVRKHRGAKERGGYDDRRMEDDVLMESGSTMSVGKIYTQEELKTITVDIFRPLQAEGTSTKRVIFNPNDVVVVRRPNEGQRPIFDREEIRKAQAEKNEGGEMNERRVVAIIKERSSSPRSNRMDFSDAVDQRENFQIDTKNFQSYGRRDDDDNLGSTRPSLNDRWQKTRTMDWNVGGGGGGSGAKFNMEESRHSPLAPTRNFSPDFSYGSGRGRHQSGSMLAASPPYDDDGGYFPERVPMDSRDSSRRDYEAIYGIDSGSPSRRRSPLAIFPNDLRHSLSSKRRHSMESRQRRDSSTGTDRNRARDFGDRMQQQQHRRSRSWDRRAPDGMSSATRSGQEELTQFTTNNGRDFRDDVLGGSGAEQEQQHDEQLPNFSSRPGKYRYQEWLNKPDMVPKGHRYYEHDNREDRYFVRGRGRGFVNRGRTGYTSRFRGGGSGSGGVTGYNRGFQHHQSQTTRTKWSPGNWQHDMFETTPDRDGVRRSEPSHDDDRHFF